MKPNLLISWLIGVITALLLATFVDEELGLGIVIGVTVP